MVSRVNIVIIIKTTLKIIIDWFKLPIIPIIVYTDSYSLYKYLVKFSTTKEKRLIINIIEGTPKSRSDPYCPMGVPFRLILSVRSSWEWGSHLLLMQRRYVVATGRFRFSVLNAVRTAEILWVLALPRPSQQPKATHQEQRNGLKNYPTSLYLGTDRGP